MSPRIALISKKLQHSAFFADFVCDLYFCWEKSSRKVCCQQPNEFKNVQNFKNVPKPSLWKTPFCKKNVFPKRTAKNPAIKKYLPTRAAGAIFNFIYRGDWAEAIWTPWHWVNGRRERHPGHGMCGGNPDHMLLNSQIKEIKKNPSSAIIHSRSNFHRDSIHCNRSKSTYCLPPKPGDELWQLAVGGRLHTSHRSAPFFKQATCPSSHQTFTEKGFFSRGWDKNHKNEIQHVFDH